MFSYNIKVLPIFNIYCDIYLCHYKYSLQCSSVFRMFLGLEWWIGLCLSPFQEQNCINATKLLLRILSMVQVCGHHFRWLLTSKTFFCKCQIIINSSAKNKEINATYADVCKILENAIHTLTSSISSSMPMLYRSWWSSWVMLASKSIVWLFPRCTDDNNVCIFLAVIWICLSSNIASGTFDQTKPVVAGFFFQDQHFQGLLYFINYKCISGIPSFLWPRFPLTHNKPVVGHASTVITSEVGEGSGRTGT